MKQNKIKRVAVTLTVMLLIVLVGLAGKVSPADAVTVQARAHKASFKCHVIKHKNFGFYSDGTPCIPHPKKKKLKKWQQHQITCAFQTLISLVLGPEAAGVALAVCEVDAG